MDSESMIVGWLKIGGSFASRDIPGVLLKSAMVMDMDRVFHCEERSIGKTTVSIFFGKSSRTGLILSCS